MSAPAAEDAVTTDALIIGAGPVGLFQAFQLGLQGISAHIVDVLPMAGGQCAALYPGKLIHDIPALPPCTGAELADRLVAQIRPFTPVWHLGREVSGIRLVDANHPDAGYRVTLRKVGNGPPGTTDEELTVRFVFVAAGVGAFQPKALRVPGLDAWLGVQVFHHLPALNAAMRTVRADPGAQVIVLGGEEEAIDSALALAAQAPGRISLVYRRSPLEAGPASLGAFDAACAQGALRFVIGQPSACVAHDGRLTALQISTADDDVFEVPADFVLARQGLSPKLGKFADWGLALDRKQLPVNPASFATSLPGVYAVGDVNTYPGKRKLIVCGFHEATLAAFDAASVLAGAPVPLEYTTSSAKLQRRLGVVQG